MKYLIRFILAAVLLCQAVTVVYAEDDGVTAPGPMSKPSFDPKYDTAPDCPYTSPYNCVATAAYLKEFFYKELARYGLKDEDAVLVPFSPSDPPAAYAEYKNTNPDECASSTVTGYSPAPLGLYSFVIDEKAGQTYTPNKYWTGADTAYCGNGGDLYWGDDPLHNSGKMSEDRSFSCGTSFRVLNSVGQENNESPKLGHLCRNPYPGVEEDVECYRYFVKNPETSFYSIYKSLIFQVPFSVMEPNLKAWSDEGSTWNGAGNRDGVRWLVHLFQSAYSNSDMSTVDVKSVVTEIKKLTDQDYIVPIYMALLKKGSPVQYHSVIATDVSGDLKTITTVDSEKIDGTVTLSCQENSQGFSCQSSLAKMQGVTIIPQLESYSRSLPMELRTIAESYCGSGNQQGTGDINSNLCIRINTKGGVRKWVEDLNSRYFEVNPNDKFFAGQCEGITHLLLRSAYLASFVGEPGFDYTYGCLSGNILDNYKVTEGSGACGMGRSSCHLEAIPTYNNFVDSKVTGLADDFDKMNFLQACRWKTIEGNPFNVKRTHPFLSALTGIVGAPGQCDGRRRNASGELVEEVQGRVYPGIGYRWVPAGGVSKVRNNTSNEKLEPVDSTGCVWAHVNGETTRTLEYKNGYIFVKAPSSLSINVSEVESDPNIPAVGRAVAYENLSDAVYTLSPQSWYWNGSFWQQVTNRSATLNIVMLRAAMESIAVGKGLNLMNCSSQTLDPRFENFLASALAIYTEPGGYVIGDLTGDKNITSADLSCFVAKELGSNLPSGCSSNPSLYKSIEGKGTNPLQKLTSGMLTLSGLISISTTSESSSTALATSSYIPNLTDVASLQNTKDPVTGRSLFYPEVPDVQYPTVCGDGILEDSELVIDESKDTFAVDENKSCMADYQRTDDDGNLTKAKLTLRIDTTKGRGFVIGGKDVAANAVEFNCGQPSAGTYTHNCSRVYDVGSTVSLIASDPHKVSSTDGYFGGWAGACTSYGKWKAADGQEYETCEIKLTEDKELSLSFDNDPVKYAAPLFDYNQGNASHRLYLKFGDTPSYLTSISKLSVGGCEPFIAGEMKQCPLNTAVDSTSSGCGVYLQWQDTSMPTAGRCIVKVEYLTGPVGTATKNIALFEHNFTTDQITQLDASSNYLKNTESYVSRLFVRTGGANEKSIWEGESATLTWYGQPVYTDTGVASNCKLLENGQEVAAVPAYSGALKEAINVVTPTQTTKYTLRCANEVTYTVRVIPKATPTSSSKSVSSTAVKPSVAFASPIMASEAIAGKALTVTWTGTGFDTATKGRLYLFSSNGIVSNPFQNYIDAGVSIDYWNNVRLSGSSFSPVLSKALPAGGYKLIMKDSSGTTTYGVSAEFKVKVSD